MASFQTRILQHAGEIGLPRTILAHQAHALRQQDLEARKTGYRRVSLALIADHKDAPITRTKQQKRLLEPRLET